MHYHRALVRLFESTFGARFLELIKPTPGRESWLGFDQGWAKIAIEPKAFEDELRDALAKKAAPKSLMFGYFLQFKCVKQILRHRARRDGTYIADPQAFDAPYLRAQLDLRAKRGSGTSQHELLMQLAGVRGADVHYACPMIFEGIDVYSEPDLDTLALIDVADAPTGWSSDEEHHILFQTETSTPYWASRPIRTDWVEPEDWIREAAPADTETLLHHLAVLAEVGDVGPVFNILRLERGSRVIERPRS